MKVFTIEHTEFGHDYHMGYVMVVNSEEEAREIAKNKATDEG